MANDFIIDRLKIEFKERESFSREELYAFYRQLEPNLNETTFRWRIYSLKAKKIITVISRGRFTLSYKPVFKPQVDDLIKKIFIKIKKEFPTLKLCIWSTQIIHEFMLHIPGRFMTILQVEKEAIEPVYDFLKEQNFKNIFIQPEEKEIERYIYDRESAIILQVLISKSPIQKINTVSTITLEKLIVDLYCDKKIFDLFQGSELAHIINSAYNRYSIDFTKLLQYAKRRRKEIELREFLLNKTDIPRNILND